MKLSKENFEKLMEMSKDRILSRHRIKEVLGVSESKARAYRVMLENVSMLHDKELIYENVKLAKQRQRYQDSNRIERKSFREHARVENALEALNQAVISRFDDVKLNIKPVVSKLEKSSDIAIIQLADPHFNELVDMVDNSYDFDIASKRMQLYAMKAKSYLKSLNVKKIVFAMTGDMINSDRRLDEKLNMATNRMTAALIATNLIEYFILDLLDEFESIDVAYVTGNESRVDEFGFSDMVVTDNYDTSIFNMLKLIFRDTERVTFIKSDPVETVLGINGKNILLLHGTTIGRDTQKSIQQIVGKYAAKGIVIDYALFGHIHFANVTDLYARSGSLVGSNSYSDRGLNLVSKPSQNITIVRENGEIDGIRMELSNVKGVEGYPIESDLDAYNAKSASKLHKGYKVMEIII